MTRDETIRQLRDAALSLVMLKGTWHPISRTKIISRSVGGIEITFGIFAKRGRLKYPFKLDVCAPNEVLSVEWDEAGKAKTSFRRGAWEQSLLLAAHRLVGPASL
jgi:hypothetical protein